MKVKFVLIYIFLLIFISSCVSSTNIIDNSKNYSDYQEVRVQGSESIISTSSKDEISYESKSEAEDLLTYIKYYFDREQYDLAISTASVLHEQYNGTKEDIEGQKIANDSQKIIDENNVKQKDLDESIENDTKTKQKQNVQKLIRVLSVEVDEINSVGGVSMVIYWRNQSIKTIKYITFEVEPYNAVGDAVFSKIGFGSIKKGELTGPVEKTDIGQYFYYKNNWEWVGGIDENTPYVNGYNGYHYLNKNEVTLTADAIYWECIWYNHTIRSIKLLSIEIEYMDGSKEIIDNDYIEYAIW